MADNIEITPGSGEIVRADEILGQKYQCVKLALGADGVLDSLVAAGQTTKALSIPVVIASDQEFCHATEDTTSIPSAARNSDSNSADISVANYKEALFFINCTAKTDDSKCNVIIKTKDPLSSGYVEIARYELTDIGTFLLSLNGGLGKYIRVYWETAAAFTFSVGIQLKS
jgi:hypothetical protein